MCDHTYILCPDDAKQDPVVYGAEFCVVFLEKGPRTASIQEGFGLYQSDLEGDSAEWLYTFKSHRASCQPMDQTQKDYNFTLIK